MDLEKVVNIDLMELHKRQNIHGILVADLGSRINVAPTNGCALCQFMYQNRTGHSGAHELRAFSYLRTAPTINASGIKFHQPSDTVNLGIVSSHSRSVASAVSRQIRKGAIFCAARNQTIRDEPMFRPKLLYEQADFGVAKPWIDYCVEHHNKCKDTGEQIEDLKLIDCTSRNRSVCPQKCLLRSIKLCLGLFPNNYLGPIQWFEVL